MKLRKSSLIENRGKQKKKQFIKYYVITDKGSKSIALMGENFKAGFI